MYRVVLLIALCGCMASPTPSDDSPTEPARVETFTFYRNATLERGITVCCVGIGSPDDFLVYDVNSTIVGIRVSLDWTPTAPTVADELQFTMYYDFETPFGFGGHPILNGSYSPPWIYSISNVTIPIEPEEPLARLSARIRFGTLTEADPINRLVVHDSQPYSLRIELDWRAWQPGDRYDEEQFRPHVGFDR